jgi:FlaA1/EpsC-like NDP-sugar epimerase
MHSYIKIVLKLSRRQKITLQIALDAALLAFSYFGAIMLQVENSNFLVMPAMWCTLFASNIITLLAFWVFGLYSVLVRFITGSILNTVLKGAVVGAISFYAVGNYYDANLPHSVPIIFSIFAFLSVSGSRFVARNHFRIRNKMGKKPIIIYGAGEAGRQLLNAILHGNEFAPIAFVDDNPSLINLKINELHVHAPDRIPHLISETGVRLILLAIPSLSHVRRREIVKALEGYQLMIKTIPSMSDVISGRAKISELRHLSVDDLLGREPVAPDPQLLGKNITGRVVMVTGAGGSIGSELCRQILTQNPSVLLLFDMSEFALYSIEAELSAARTRLQHHARVVPILGSVQDTPRLEAAIKAFNVQTIYHAAAYKHVPLVEENVVEGIMNNVFGTLAVTNAAQKLAIENFILVSTDKAVRPTNVMGATKRIAELICQAHSREVSSTIFSMVRFGNVLGSSGSVIPRFRAQIEAGGPITLTHKDVNRYFMTIPEAAQLVIQAGALGQGGDVFVLDMGQPVKIMDLAFSMVKLHGLVPYMVDHPNQIMPAKGDIPVYVSGLRKGEKLYEELLIDNDPTPTKHPRILTASEPSVPRDELMAVLDRLLQACQAFDVPAIVVILHELPLGYAPSSKDVFDLVWRASELPPNSRIDFRIT